jgi:hypothetical protein
MEYKYRVTVKLPDSGRLLDFTVKGSAVDEDSAQADAMLRAESAAKVLGSVAVKCEWAPHTLAEWLALPTDRYQRAPYDRPCPACGESMTHPTSCACDYEKRVWALAGLDGFEPWTRANVVAVNRAMRALDDSGSWPIRSRFNGTDRAIRRARVGAESLDSYVRAVDAEIGRIVNDPSEF